jgi:hypothetical protein
MKARRDIPLVGQKIGDLRIWNFHTASEATSTEVEIQWWHAADESQVE